MKNEEAILIMTPKDKKEQFQMICASKNSTMKTVLNDYIDHIIRKHWTDELSKTYDSLKK